MPQMQFVRLFFLPYLVHLYAHLCFMLIDATNMNDDHITLDCWLKGYSYGERKHLASHFWARITERVRIWGRIRNIHWHFTNNLMPWSHLFYVSCIQQALNITFALCTVPHSVQICLFFYLQFQYLKFTYKWGHDYIKYILNKVFQCNNPLTCQLQCSWA